MSSPNDRSSQPPAREVGIPALAINSALHFMTLTRQRALYRPSERLRHAYRVDDDRVYLVFRETDTRIIPTGSSNVLIVGFQLKALGGHPIPHWIFQRCCLLTTPFWSGLPGFTVKLWMVDPVTKRYLGIYDWRGLANTQHYVEALARVLRSLSKTDSVWYRILPECALENYLADHAVDLAQGSSI